MKIQTPCEILCEWAFAKANLENLHRDHREHPIAGGTALIADAIHSFQRALRKKKKLDADYHQHHEALEMSTK